MAGGTWSAQNKVRAGAYINFKAVSADAATIGTRGVMTMPVAMSWGPEKKVTELFSTDLTDGKSLAKIGYTATDPESLIFRAALGNCVKAYIYRLDAGGTKASGTSGNLTAVAKYTGTTGNKIKIVIADNDADANSWDVITLFNNAEKDRQTILKTAEISALESNAWVDWTGTGELAATAGFSLVGGVNGTVSADTYSADDGYFASVKGLNWNTMAIPQTDDIASGAVKSAVVSLIKELRERQGKKVQAVLFNSAVNYEGIISVKQGFSTADEDITPEMFTAYVAGLTAGSEINVSNTYRVIENAVEIIYPEGVVPYDNDTIEKLLKTGQFILTTRQDGAIIIEKDINTLHAPYPSADVNYSFTKNRVIRTLDGINNDIKALFEETFIGKVDNNDNGRNVFKSSVISYLLTLQDMAAITEFNSATDIEVLAGNEIDSVVVNLAVKPVDSMEKLYMTVYVN